MAYSSDVKDDEWSFVAPYLCLMSEDAPQRDYTWRDVFNALRYLAHTGCPWRYLPGDLPPWATVWQQWARWRNARVFEATVHDLTELQRVLLERPATSSAVVLDGRTLPSTLESGHRAGGRAGTEPSGAREVRRTLPSIRWASC